MIQSPKAIDFTCTVDGVVRPWNCAFGLKCRWLAAGICKTCDPSDLLDAAERATAKIREELGNDSVVVEAAS
jgi:hypothetical protein